jgi:hypothetical protein
VSIVLRFLLGIFLAFIATAYLLGFLRWRDASIQNSALYRQAQYACEQDGQPQCNFDSEGSARKYLSSDAHTAAVNKRREAQEYTECISKAIDFQHLKACEKLNPGR